MRRELGLRQARRAAVALLARCGVTTAAHVELERFAVELGVDLVAGGVEDGRARLQYGLKPTVRVSEQVVVPGAVRFAVAHELGHYALQHPPSEGLSDLRPRGCGPDERDFEAEADAFAAELLMPTALVRRRCDVSPLDLDVARAIADEYRVSVIAAALRVVELTDERAAVVYSERGAIRWARSSAALPWQLPRGQRLDRGTVAADYFRGRALDERAQPIAIGAWFASERVGEAELVEHSMALDGLRAVMTLLWIPEVVAAGLRLDDSQSVDPARDEPLSYLLAR